MSGSRMRRSVASIAVLVLAGLTGCSGSGDKIYGKNSLPPVNRSIGMGGSPLAGANNGGGLASNGGGFQANPGMAANPLASQQQTPGNFVVPANGNARMDPQLGAQPASYQYPAAATGQNPGQSNAVANPNSSRSPMLGQPTFNGNPAAFGGPQPLQNPPSPQMPTGTVPLPGQQSNYAPQPAQTQYTPEQIRMFQQMQQQMQAQQAMQPQAMPPQPQMQMPVQQGSWTMQPQPAQQPQMPLQSIRVEPADVPPQTGGIRVPAIPPAPTMVPPENLPRNPEPEMKPNANFTLRPDTSAPTSGAGPMAAPGVGTGGIVIPQGGESGMPANLPPIRVNAGEPGPRVLSTFPVPRVGDDPSYDAIPPAPVLPSGDGFRPGMR